MNKGILIFGLAFVLLTTLAGINYFSVNKKQVGELPQYALRTPKVQAAYEYALEDQDLLKHIPCYCNCHRLGHQHVGECFVKDIKESGEVVFDNHGSNCGTCYNIVLESKSLKEQGKIVQEIREYIDNKYSQYGQPTFTPKP